MNPTMITHPYWLDPTPDPTNFHHFDTYFAAVLKEAPYDASLELRGALGVSNESVPYVTPGLLPFKSKELQNGGDSHKYMPADFWANAVAPVLLGSLARRLIVACGASGLVSVALYRPKGGAKLSQHKTASAFDVRLLKKDQTPELKRAMACVAAWIYRNGSALRVSVGTYSSGDAATLVHFDTGRSKRRCWTNVGSDKAKWCTWHGEAPHASFVDLARSRGELGKLPVSARLGARKEDQPWLTA